MATFVFQAKSVDGKVVKGEVEADNQAEARVKIRAQKFIPINVLPKDQVKAKGQGAVQFKVGKISAKELQVFTRQFAVLLAAGVPIVQSIEAMMGGARSVPMNATLKGILDNLERGKRLGDALALFPTIFDRMYVNLVKAGEEGGVLDQILNRLAEYIEKSVKLKGKVVGALWYPAGIIGVASLVIFGILTFVIPEFVELFKSAGTELPALTQMVINLSNFMKKYWYLAISAMGGIPFGLVTFYKSEEGRKTCDRIFIRTPIFGSLIQKSSIARFSRTLSTLLGAGVRIVDALEIAAATAGNFVIENVLLMCKESISRGRSVAEPIKKSKFIPPMVAQMIDIGEQTGNLDVMLGKIADFYESEVEAAAEALTSLIEPILMVFLGGIIAVLVVAMYLPIFNLAGAVK